MNLKQEIKSHIRDVKDFPKKGIVFKDITPVLKNPLLCSNIVKQLSSYLTPKTTHVVGVESRGFLFGLPLTIENNLSFVLIRKKGKLPYKTISTDYDLEYGKATIEMNFDDVGPGDRVVIHDDLLATGGTAIAAAKLVIQQGAIVDGFSFVVELDFLKGRDRLDEFSKNINSIVQY